MIITLIKAFIIGICVSVPIGPAAIFVMQKSLGYGHKAGFVSGLGVTTLDTLSAIISVFALAIASKFINAHTNLLMFIGGGVVAVIGAGMAFSNPFKKLKESCAKVASWSFKDYFQAFLAAASNPGAVFCMLALFAFFKLGNLPHDLQILPVILMVSAGSMTYWFFFSWLFSHLRKNLKIKTLVTINRIAGIIVIIIGIGLCGSGLYNLIF